MKEITFTKTKHTEVVVAFFLFLLTLKLNWLDLGLFPSGIHIWTQTDQFALTMGYVNNGLDFFHPQLLAIPYEYPIFESHGHHNSVTAVDFPIHNYIQAVIMTLLNTKSTLITQVYMLFLSVTGLTYLFKTARIYTSFSLALAITFFIALSPTYSYYQLRYIPSVPSLSTAFIGLYFAAKYHLHSQHKHLILATSFLLLAALTRMTFLIPLISWFGYLFFAALAKKDRKNLLMHSVSIAGSILVYLSYFSYNQYLKSHYNNMFLSHLMPAKDWSQFTEILTYIRHQWLFQYLTKAHYFLLFTSCVIWMFYTVKKRGKTNPLDTLNFPYLFLIFILFGAICFCLLMFKQFNDHDYYFIDTFLFPIALLLIVFLKNITNQVLVKFLSLAFILSSFWMNLNAQNQRKEQARFGDGEMLVNSYVDSEILLNKLHIPKSAKLLLLDRQPTNLPFFFLNRTGYVVMKSDRLSLEHSLNLPVQYVIFLNEYFIPNIYNKYPEIINKLRVIDTNGKISICKLDKTHKNSLETFLKLNVENSKKSWALSLNNPEWVEPGFHKIPEDVFLIQENAVFGPVFKLHSSDLLTKPNLIYFTGKIRGQDLDKLDCVFSSVLSSGVVSDYKSNKLIIKNAQQVGWIDFKFLFNSKPIDRNGELSIYFLNNNGITYEVRDVNVSFY